MATKQVGSYTLKVVRTEVPGSPSLSEEAQSSVSGDRETVGRWLIHEGAALLAASSVPDSDLESVLEMAWDDAKSNALDRRGL